MSKMPDRFSPHWCYVCNKPAAIDCPGKYETGKQVRLRLKRMLRKEVIEALSDK